MTDKSTFIYIDGMTADSNYIQWIADIKSRYGNIQIKAAIKSQQVVDLLAWPN